MYYYRVENKLAASFLDLPLESAGAGVPQLFLVKRELPICRCAWRVTDARQLSAQTETVAWFDPRRMGETPKVDDGVAAAIAAGTLTAIDVGNPKWREAITYTAPKEGKKRVHLLAVGDVGSTLLTALKLLGGDVISTIGICDLNDKTIARWTTEMGQISWPWNYDSMPEVEAVDMERLFQCDVFIFAATKAIPAVGSAVKDVRMAQLEANAGIVAHYARMARAVDYKGLFMVLSDPVDQLCQAAYHASNKDENGAWDGRGLLPEQVQGYGLGVMTARAAYYAKQDKRLASYLTEGRSFGPHGKGLLIANSVEHYDDELSQILTERTVTANLKMREIGFKPYVAPAVSSGAMQLLLTLRGQWHCGSVCLGGIWFGVRNRYTANGLEVETLDLPDGLYARLQETEEILRSIPVK